MSSSRGLRSELQQEEKLQPSLPIEMNEDTSTTLSSHANAANDLLLSLESMPTSLADNSTTTSTTKLAMAPHQFPSSTTIRKINQHHEAKWSLSSCGSSHKGETFREKCDDVDVTIVTGASTNTSSSGSASAGGSSDDRECSSATCSSRHVHRNGRDHLSPSSPFHCHDYQHHRSTPTSFTKRKLRASSSASLFTDRESPDIDEPGENGSGNSSSGSETEEGYEASASSNENRDVSRGKSGGCSSPSVSSTSDDSCVNNPKQKRLKTSSSFSVSSEIADYSSGSDDDDFDVEQRLGFAGVICRSPCHGNRSSSQSLTSSSDEQEDDVYLGDVGEKEFTRKLTSASSTSASIQNHFSFRDETVPSCSYVASMPQGALLSIDNMADKHQPMIRHLGGKSPMFAIGSDVLAHMLTYLEPTDILDVLTMPLSKDWVHNFTRQPELWRVLCLSDPFKVQAIREDSNGVNSASSSGDGWDSISSCSDNMVDSHRAAAKVERELRISFGKFRLLYTSFVRCSKYLSRIKDDALHGRPPSVIDYGVRPTAASHSIRANENLHHFLAQARRVVVRNRQISGLENSDFLDDIRAPNIPAIPLAVEGTATADASTSASTSASASASAFDVADDGRTITGFRRKTHHREAEGCASDTNSDSLKRKKRRPKFGHSMLTQRLLRPVNDGTLSHNELPWSCAIYSIVNWMVAFSEVEGIQAMCLKVLPFVLEDERQRMTAQRAGVTDICLRAMVMFPDSSSLHTAAFHTIVLLARPLGGKEGMLFHSSMVNSSGIFSPENGSSDGRNGIAVMLDSMRRFQYDEALQAMSCWSLVNIALASSQKEMLVKLGGIEVTTNAMTIHPHSNEVQFRALFALINLVIPSVNLNANTGEGDGDAMVSVDDSSEKDMLDDQVHHLVNLVVMAMKNFCANEAILNRACLVLHNLSLTQEYHEHLLFAPNCYQMLEWCLANYPTDQVLQQSAAGTLHRLQITMSGDNILRRRFTASLQQHQHASLEQAHREAMLLQEEHERRVRLAQGEPESPLDIP